MHRLKSLLGVLISLVIITGMFGGIVLAQSTGTGYVVSPVLDDTVILNPGETAKRIITIKNPTATEITVKVVANDFEPSDNESGTPRFDFDGTNTVNYANKFTSLVEPIDDVKLLPNKDTQVEVVFKAPSDANPGGYYGAIRFQPIVAAGEQQLNLAASIGTLYLVTVPGDLVYKLDLVEFTAARKDSTGRFFLGKGDGMQIVTRLKNSGNIHAQPFGKITIADNKGNIVESIDFNTGDQKMSVLPDSTRKFVNEVQKDSFFGKYTITTNLGYENSSELITAKNTFWVIPVWILIVAVGLIVAIILFAIIIYRKLRQSRKHKVTPRRK